VASTAVAPDHAGVIARAIDGKFSVVCGFQSTGFVVPLNRSFMLFVKSSSTVPA
jgi:hypothetical protein